MAKPKEYVTKNMTIGDVVEKYPDAAQILTEKGLHCIGCSVQFWETLEGGFKGHGWSDELIDETISEINSYLKEQEKEQRKNHQEVVRLTEKAAKELKKLLAEEKDSKIKGIRIQAIAAGCSEFQYGMDFEKEIMPGDTLVKQHGLTLIIDSESKKCLKGCEVEYVNNKTESGFKFKRPNKSERGCNGKDDCKCGKGDCGCGKGGDSHGSQSH